MALTCIWFLLILRTSPGSEPCGDTWGQGWPFESFSNPPTVSVDSRSLKLLKMPFTKVSRMPIPSLVPMLEMRKERLRERNCFVIHDKWPCQDLWLQVTALSTRIRRRLGVSSLMQSYLVPVLKAISPLPSSKEFWGGWGGKEKGKIRERPLTLREVEDPSSLPLWGCLAKSHFTSAAPQMSRC